MIKLEIYIQDKVVRDLDSKELIKYFLNHQSKDIYIKLVLHCFCVAAVTFSVECSVESLVSRYETHFDKSRQLKEEGADYEIVISENGPLLHMADPVIKRSLNHYFRDNNKRLNGR